jgi:hypothetical protein
MKFIKGIPPKCHFSNSDYNPLPVTEYPVKLFSIKIPAVNP